MKLTVVMQMVLDKAVDMAVNWEVDKELTKDVYNNELKMSHLQHSEAPLQTREGPSACDCEPCAKAFSSENNFKMHMKVHAWGLFYIIDFSSPL